MKLNDEKQAQALALIESMPWGDLGPWITTFERGLRLALAAAAHWLPLWEKEGEDRFTDEFSLTPEQVGALSDEWRLAYVARLVVTMTLAYGVSTGVWDGKPAVRDAESSSMAALLRGLAAIVVDVLSSAEASTS